MMSALNLTPKGYLLGQLLSGITDAGEYAGLSISSITLDSRQTVPGSLFIALAGHREHGINHLDQAVRQGAVAVLVDAVPGMDELPLVVDANGRLIPLLRMPRLGEWVGIIAERFYANPSHALQLIGITGTNGKTSVSHFIAQALQTDGPCGIIGTLGSGVIGEITADSGRTTPDAISLHARLAEFHERGIRRVVMEVSSHGLEQHRVGGVDFDVAVFTNLSHEHLDYHGCMDNYAAVKRRLFLHKGLRHAVLNLDDPYARAWLAELPKSLDIITYALEGGAQPVSLLAEDICLSASGVRFTIRSTWGVAQLKSALLGRFNVANLLAALGALIALGIDFNSAVERLAQVTTVAGRMESFGGHDAALGVVDYAHTPDALEHVLIALREHCAGKLICVFGCGGDRDREKRPLMGAIAERLADKVIVTNDNPRNEEPQRIIDEIVTGAVHAEAITVIPDRAEAIACAHRLAGAGDVVLIAGKGHEQEQVIGTRRLPFSDRDVVQRLFVQGGGHV